MAFQAVPDTAEVTVVFQQNGESITNTFHVEKPGGYDITDIEFIAEKVDAHVGSDLLPEMTLDCAYVRTEVRGLEVENDLFNIANTEAGVGASASPGLPNSVTLSLKKLSGLTGRSARGRWYFIGLALNALDANENVFLAQAVIDTVAALEVFRVGVIAGGWLPVIVSRFAGGIPRDEGKTFAWIDTVAVNDNVDSQRRRLTR